jgi:hypothetical protein
VLGLDAANGTDIAVADVDADGMDDIAVEGAGGTPVFLGNELGDMHGDGAIGDHQRSHGIVSGRFAEPPPAMVVRHREIAGTWTLLEGGHGAANFQQRALLATGTASDAGDLDGDGYDDLVLVDSWVVTAAFGGATDGGLFACAEHYPLATPGSMVAVGDRDGDGAAEIAVTHGLQIDLFGVPE